MRAARAGVAEVLAGWSVKRLMSEALFRDWSLDNCLRDASSKVSRYPCRHEEREALTFEETEDLRRDLRTLLHRERMEIASAEVDKAEQVLAYMIGRASRTA